MLGFVQSWFTPGANPIGVDFGSDCLRLAQVERMNNEFRLVAAASVDVPVHVRNDATARLAFFAESLRDLLRTGNFRGRRALLALPASCMHIQHLRLPRMEEEALRKALPWEARGKLPIDPSHALLRHIVAGEVYQDQEPKTEVIVMAARRDYVEQLLAAAAKARLDIVGMNSEPKALLDCFSHLYRRKTDAEITNLFVDIGCVATRAMVAHNGNVLFVRAIPIGGEHFSRAVASSLKIPLDDARMLRIKLCAAQPAGDEQRDKRAFPADPAVVPAAASASDPSIDNSFALLEAGLRAGGQGDAAGTTAVAEAPAAIEAPFAVEAPVTNDTFQRQSVDDALREPLAKLVEELSLCRRYHEATFPNRPVERLIFVGGEARHRGLCQSIAREMGVAAQVGDPLVRMGRISEPALQCGLDRRVPQPSWALAIGLSMGPVGVEAVKS
ncbi:MAG: type pilus assembly protein PilM [Phycisphaerales bacterium]|nr:type pilus assembly protein PilM [Phycisphaerales bacterium]